MGGGRSVLGFQQSQVCSCRMNGITVWQVGVSFAFHSKHAGCPFVSSLHPYILFHLIIYTVERVSASFHIFTKL